MAEKLCSLRKKGGGEKFTVVNGTLNITAGGQETVNLGFKPKKLVVQRYYNGTWWTSCIYDEVLSDTAYSRYYNYGGNIGVNFNSRTLPDYNTSGLSEILSNGFVINVLSHHSDMAGTWYYFAIG